jgi:energy-coupling factor transport system ATP-binding protein
MDLHILANKLTINYQQRAEPVLDSLDLRIRPGEFVVIAGPSGCGKSTFSRSVIGLIPHLTKGTITSGSLEVCGLDTQSHAIHDLTQHAGLVFQDPDTNIFSLIVLDELAFGAENMGISREEIVQRIENSSDWVGIRNLWTRHTDQLSGGQKQRVAIAGALATMPEMLVLDEPTTDLDPIGKKQVINTLKELKERLGVTMIVIEHDLSNLLEVADRLIIMGDRGQVLCDDIPSAVLSNGYEFIQQSGIRMPTFSRIGLALRFLGCPVDQVPLNSSQAVQLLSEFKPKISAVCETLEFTYPPATHPNNPPVIQVSDLSFQYHQKGEPILKGLNLDIKQSEFVAVVGSNGSGKSTLLKLMIGLLKPGQGKVRILDRSQQPVSSKDLSNHISFVFQNPDHQLFENTVWEEVAFGLRVRKESSEVIEKRVSEVLGKVNLLHLKDRHPATLSRGEKRRLAVATALSHPIDILLLDEPTTGQDRHTLEGLFGILKRLNTENGTAVVFVTHDMWTVWNYASRVVGMREGTILFDGPTGEILHPSNAHLLQELELVLPMEAYLGSMLAETIKLHEPDRAAPFG